MIYKKIVSGLFVALVFGGCSQVAPDIPSNGGSNVGDSDALSSQTVTIDENNINSNGGNGLNSVNNPYNSSSDGFNSLYFDFGAYSISNNMQSVLAHDIQRAKQTSGKIKIEGNCDEFGTDEYNYALGLKRAKAVKDAMGSQGLDTSRVLLVSYGESSPICSSQTDSCYAKNRRVDLRISR